MKPFNSLSSKALLVSVNISVWTGRKLDRQATKTANTAHAAAESAGSYHKKLLPGAAELELISTIASQARKYFYEQTLPWLSDGSRIIPSQNYIKFVNEFRAFRQKFDAAVNSFAAAYPALQQDAQYKLGSLYNPKEYPDPGQIFRKFSLEVNFLPMPDVSDFRVEISEQEKKEFLEKMHQVEANAIKDCWGRLHQVVKTAADKLTQPDAIFRDSLLSNINEIVALLPALNVSNDPALESSRREVESLVAGLSADVLRDNKTERQKAADSLSEIEAKMRDFMGPA